MTEAHVCEIGSSHLEDGLRAACSCGWQGEQRPLIRDARSDFAAHALTFSLLS